MEIKTKSFDCVEMKHEGALKVQSEISTLDLERELAYWQRGTDELRARQRARQAAVNTEAARAYDYQTNGSR